MRRGAPSLAIVMLLGAGCTAPALAEFSAGDPSPDGAATTTTTGGTSLAPIPTTSAGPGPAATTGDPGTTSIGGGSTGDPLAPPAIVEHDLAPNPLEQPGPIDVAIATTHAHGVRMQVDGGAAVDLTSAQADAFHGQIHFYSALDNGDHEATFVAWRDALESAPLVVPFTVALPAGGSGLYWHGDGTPGPGVVVALAVTPAHDLIELGTYYPNGQPRCYLRRRDLGGAWGPGDLLDVMPDTTCGAIDLAVDAAGALHVLAERQLNGELRWWLGRIDAWGLGPVNIGSGAPGDVAFALALDPTRVAVCGTKDKPTDLDAAAWIFSLNQPGKVLAFDYGSDAELPKNFSETARDCLFAGDTLVLTGDAYGEHDIGQLARERHFLLEVDTATEERAWHLADLGSGTQSRAHAIAVDPDGRYVTVGHTCEDMCAPQAELRVFLPGGVQIWQHALAPAVKLPRAAAWSLTDAIVYAAARDEGQVTSSFFVEAWSPLYGVETWSYAHLDGPGIHAAHALAIGPSGQIYAGGVTAGGYPALAIIAP